MASESTAKEERSQSCITTWCAAMSTGPSRAAVADASVLVPSSTAVRISTAPPALRKGATSAAAPARLRPPSAAATLSPPSSSRRRQRTAR